ncbi:MAG: hypothetical protein QRY74_01440 [Chlamydia sp.]
MSNQIITTFNPTQEIVFSIPITKEDAEEFINQSQGCSPVVTELLGSCLKPVQIYKTKDFLENSYLPAASPQKNTKDAKIMRIKKKAFNNPSIIGAFTVDPITTPIKLMSALPNLFSKGKKENSPLYKWLEVQNAPQEILKLNFVFISILEKTEPQRMNIIKDGRMIIQRTLMKNTVATFCVNFTGDSFPLHSPIYSTEEHTIESLIGYDIK